MRVAAQAEAHEHRLQSIEKRLGTGRKAKGKAKMKRPASQRNVSRKKPGSKVKKKKNGKLK